MRTTQTISQTRDTLDGGPPVALVPTMGALHEGHASLMRRARELADRVVVSIFVNPIQFGPGEDLSRYPRPLERDLAMCEREGVDLVFHPEAAEIYPPGEPECVIDLPGLTSILEGAHRPGHFVGVCRVVTKLLNIVRPAVACFGMKDYQQLRIVESMVTAMAMPVRIEACPTVREADGLAMSSRNAFLNAQQRRHALGLSQALEQARDLIGEGRNDPQSVSEAMWKAMAAHHVEPLYAEVRDAMTLASLESLNPKVEPIVCLVAGRVGGVRLIDNTVIGA